MWQWITDMDMAVLHWIQEHLRCGFLDAVLPWVTKLGDGGIFCIALAIILLCVPKTRKTGTAMAFAMLCGVLVGNVVLKNLIGRIRPYDVDTTIALLVARLSDFSFPSGHTLVSFEAATVLAICHRRSVGAVALTLAVLVAFSRLYLFVHYPTDVLAGVVLGVAFGFLGCRLAEWLFEAIAKKRSAQQP